MILLHFEPILTTTSKAEHPKRLGTVHARKKERMQEDEGKVMKGGFRKEALVADQHAYPVMGINVHLDSERACMAFLHIVWIDIEEWYHCSS